MLHHTGIRHDFLIKKEINHIYLSIFIMYFATSLIGIFVPIYLYSIGYQISSIVFFYFLVSFYFVLFSTLGAKIFSRIGIKYSIILSTPFLILYYLGLNIIEIGSYLFFLLPVFLSLHMIFFNYGYHMNYIEHSEKKKEGKEVSLIGILTTIATAAAPFIAGIIIVETSYDFLFLIGSFLLVLGTIPVFFLKEKNNEFPIDFVLVKKYLLEKKHSGNVMSFTGYAIESIIGRTLWPIFLIILLIKTDTVGFFVSISFIFSIIVYYFIGNFTDRFKNKDKLIRWGTLFYFFGWLGRLFVNSPLKVILVDTYKSMSQKILHVPWSVSSYDIARKEKYFMFIVTREITYNLARIIILPLVFLFFFLDFYPFLISFLLASFFTLFYPLLKKKF